MLKTRVIPTLLLSNGGVVKTTQFKKPIYVGDPINAIKIFNEKEVDEMVIIDIDATIEKRKPNFKLLEDLASEAFFPMSYGGGLNNLNDIKKIYSIGFEKIILNSAVISNPEIVSEASSIAGSSGVVVSIDIKKSWVNKYLLYSYNLKKTLKINPFEFAKEMQKRGAGEIFLTSVNKEGTLQGYDLFLIEEMNKHISIPLIACGGAGSLKDFNKAVKNGASAVAAGSMFVFHGKYKAVLITYPKYDDLEELFLS